MSTIIIANILTLCGSGLLTLSGIIKDKKRFLLAQSGMCVLFTAGNILLKGYTGAMVNVLNMVRNILGAENKFNKPAKILFIALQIGLTLFIGTDSLIMWLPVIGNALFTWVMDSDDMKLLKSVFSGTQLMWGVYDFTIKNYAAVPFDIAATVTAAIAVKKLIKEQEKNAVR